MVDFFQYQVPRMWYRLYWALMVLYCLFVIAGYLAGQYIPSIHHTLQPLGFGLDLTITAGTALLYLVSAYWFIERSSAPFALLVGTMLFSISGLNGISNVDPGTGAYFYVGYWTIAAFFNGMFGVPILAGSLFV